MNKNPFEDLLIEEEGEENAPKNVPQEKELERELKPMMEAESSVKKKYVPKDPIAAMKAREMYEQIDRQVARREQKKLEFRNNNNRWEKNRPKYYNKGYKKNYGRPYQKPYEKKGQFYKYEQREEKKREIFTPFQDNSKNEKEFELNTSKREDLSSETKVRKKYIPKPPRENQFEQIEVDEPKEKNFLSFMDDIPVIPKLNQQGEIVSIPYDNHFLKDDEFNSEE